MDDPNFGEARRGARTGLKLALGQHDLAAHGKLPDPG